jgi:ATP-dependent Lon protease
VEEDLTPEMMQGVDVHYASEIEDVLAVALPKLAMRVQPQSVAAEISVSAAA